MTDDIEDARLVAKQGNDIKRDIESAAVRRHLVSGSSYTIRHCDELNSMIYDGVSSPIKSNTKTSREYKWGPGEYPSEEYKSKAKKWKAPKYGWSATGNMWDSFSPALMVAIL